VLVAWCTPAVVARVEAHGGRSAHVRAVIATPVPGALDGMRIEVHDTLAPQLVLANPTAHEVEVLDDAGVAFVRVGPGGVAGNLAAPAWFQTYGPGVAVPRSARERAAEPRWVLARKEPSFGWFDPRIDAGVISVPHAVRDAGAAVDVGVWRIPLRVDGAPVTLAGVFRYEPPRAGAYAPRLTSPAEIAPGVRVRLLRGAAPGLLVENRSGQQLTVLDERGEPFLRIGPSGVDANVRSAGWSRSGRRLASPERADAHASGTTVWQRVASGSTYSWIEPRVVRAASAAGSSAPDAVLAWEIPLLLGETPLEVRGTVARRMTLSSKG
jgi:hypothetical protein